MTGGDGRYHKMEKMKGTREREQAEKRVLMERQITNEVGEKKCKEESIRKWRRVSIWKLKSCTGKDSKGHKGKIKWRDIRRRNERENGHKISLCSRLWRLGAIWRRQIAGNMTQIRSKIRVRPQAVWEISWLHSFNSLDCTVGDQG